MAHPLVSASDLPADDAPAEPLSRRERRKLEVRGRLLGAAQSLFAEHGIEATRITEICDRADVAEKTFFNYFPTKRHLLREVAQVGLGTLLADIEEARKQAGGTAARVRFFFARLSDNADEAGPMQREVLTEMVHVAHEGGAGSEHARQLHDAFAGLVEEGRSEGELQTRHDDETLTEALMGAFYVLMFNWANLEAYPLRARAEKMADYLVASMVAKAAD